MITPICLRLPDRSWRQSLKPNYLDLSAGKHREKIRNSRIMYLDGVRLHRLRLGDDLLQHAHHLLEALILPGSKPREERAQRILASPREKAILLSQLLRELESRTPPDPDDFLYSLKPGGGGGPFFTFHPNELVTREMPVSLGPHRLQPFLNRCSQHLP